MRTFARIIAIIILLLGIFLILYPTLTKIVGESQEKKAVNEFIQLVEDIQSGEKLITQDEIVENSTEAIVENTEETDWVKAISNQKIDLNGLYKEIEEYNEKLNTEGQKIVDAFSYTDVTVDLKKYGLTSNMIGYINIPKMNVVLPIYLGATTDNMKKGAAQLSQTSIPIGGKDTNTVLAGHRGYKGIPMFREILKLSIGDEITITNFWGTLTYKVVETKVITPVSSDQILIQKGKDMVTLITCHPYRQNYQRYVVYCERVK